MLAEAKKLFVYQVKNLCAEYDFEVYGVSSMVNPKDHTIMFLTSKNLDEAVGIKKCHDCGFGAAVKPRVRIGDNCIVGVGAAVIKSVSSGATVAGVLVKEISKRGANKTKYFSTRRLHHEELLCA